MLEAANFALADDRMIEVPWTFENLAEAGEFCRDLFGMSALGVEGTAEAMDREIGFDLEEGRPRLRWLLRRIVADAI